MFDIGFWELLLIGIVSLLVLGPEKMPGAIRSTVKTVRDIKNVANGFKQEVSQQLKVSELHEHLKEAEQAGMSGIGEDVKRSVEELKAAAASVQEPYKNQNTIAPTANQETQKETRKSPELTDQHSSEKTTDPVKPSDASDNDASK